MNVENIEALARVLRQNDLTMLEVEEEGCRVRLERTPAPSARTAPDVLETLHGLEELSPLEDTALGAVDFNKIHEVKSPMVGVFYASPSPDAPPFVQIGSKVRKGDTLCIIEAMKLMNEIGADEMGTVREVCLEDASPVEFGTVMFYIEPLGTPAPAPETA